MQRKVVTIKQLLQLLPPCKNIHDTEAQYLVTHFVELTYIGGQGYNSFDFNTTRNLFTYNTTLSPYINQLVCNIRHKHNNN
jgi:hypothetical protein